MASSHTNLPHSSQQEGLEPTLSEWETRPLAELIHYIVERHHGWLRTELPETQRLIRDGIERRGRERSGNLVEAEKLFLRFRREIEAHLHKEEALLFPLIERIEQAHAAGRPLPRQSFGSLQNPVQFMTQDHELAEQLLGKLKECCADPQVGAEQVEAGKTLREHLDMIQVDLQAHSHLEDAILFPRAIRLERCAEGDAA